MTGFEWTQQAASADRLRYRADDESRLARQGELILRDYLVPTSARRVLDLGCGAGRLIEVIRERDPDVSVVGLDISPNLLGQARLASMSLLNCTFAAHDLMDPLPDCFGTFDAVVSSLAIHHLPHERKAALYREVYNLLNPGGTFGDLDCDKMRSKRLKKMFRTAHQIDGSLRHPSDQPATLTLRLEWLEQAGFDDVQSYWTCLGMSLAGGRRSE